MAKPSLDEATLVKPSSEIEKSGKTLIRGPETYPLLEVQSGPKQGAWYTLVQQKETSIGRANVNSIVFEDNSVSRSHATLHQLEEKYFIKDVGSRNGTFVNDKKIQDDFLLKHGDRIKVGIYVLKFLTAPEQEASGEEVQAPAQEPTPPAPPVQVSEPPPVEPLSTPEIEKVKKIIPREKKPRLVEKPPVPVQKSAEEGRSKRVAYFLVALLLIGGLGFTIYRLSIKKALVASKAQKPVLVTSPVTTPERVASPEQNVVPPAPVAPESQPLAAAVPQAPAANGVPVFLEVESSPLPVRIFYQGKELGTTPFKTNVLVPLGAPQELTAYYHFEELNQDFSGKKSFVVSKQDELVTVRFEGSVGTLSIKGLPKDSQVYLEANFASNGLKTQTVKLADIVYSRPVYLPFGDYVLEIKKPEKLEGADTVVDVVKYHRQFSMNTENPVYALTLSDKDLSVFPAKITTTPAGAELFIDGKKMGETPFEGLLPLGKHQLLIKKEGYFDYEQALAMTMNTPFTSEFALKTSEAGEFINKGRALIRQGQYPQAIEQLAESLKHNPSPLEMGRVQLLLGQSYIQTKAYELALGYFEKAKNNEALKNEADVGIAEASLGLGNKDAAFARVIDVMLNSKDPKIKEEAENIFHKISPLKSVILVSTEPAGAKVSLNGQEIEQPTPVVLAELGLGSYRLMVEKPGYKRYEGRFELGISSFKPVLIKLDPVP